MKILLLNSFLHHGSGVSRVAVRVGNGLVDRGHEVLMLTSRGQSLEARFEIKRLGFSVNISSLRQIDVIYSHYGKLEPLSAYLKLKLKCPLVVHDHGTAFPWLFKGGSKLRYSFEFMMRAPSLRLANRIITISKFLQRINWVVYGRRSTVIYNGVSNCFFYSSRRREKVRRKLNLQERIVVLFVGRWSSHKRVRRLITIIAELRSIEPSLALVLVGSPTSERKYITQIVQAIEDARDTVVYYGSLSDGELSAFYSAADIYATCSRWEGFDLPIFEAMRTGIPIVAFKTGSHQEFANLGLSLAQNDEQFKEMLLDLASDPTLRKIKGTGGQTFAQHFSWKRALEKIEAILEDVVKK